MGEQRTNDRIERHVELNAPLSRVWRALADHREFGEWFKVELEAPFAPGRVSRGHMTYPGYEHLPWEAVVQKLEPERHFSYTWHPYAVQPGVDYSKEMPTRVEFRLQKSGNGTQLTVTESGFENLPETRRDKAFHMHQNGWTEQMRNIEQYIREKP